MRNPDPTPATSRAPEKARPEDGLFIPLPEANHFQPTPRTGGPWDPKFQHGGPVSGLLAHAIDHEPAPVPMRIVRLTVELFRGVPLTPLRVETRLVRGGKRIQSIEATLYDGATAVARASALRMRRSDADADQASDLPLDPALGRPPEVVPSILESRRFAEGTILMPGFIRAVDIVTDPPKRAGEPGNAWTRLLCRVVEGEDPSPTVRLATLVDFASGTGSALDYARYTSINPDLSIHVLREPRTAWIGLRGYTGFSADGVGQSQASVYDEEGLVARVQASLLLERRP
ncbi:MAG: thioesterase family protein [Myxococcota bacterium]